MSQVKMTQQYDETAGNVPVSKGYMEAIEASRALAAADEILGREIYDLEEAKEILNAAFVNFPGYLESRYPTIF